MMLLPLKAGTARATLFEEPPAPPLVDIVFVQDLLSVRSLGGIRRTLCRSRLALELRWRGGCPLQRAIIGLEVEPSYFGSIGVSVICHLGRIKRRILRCIHGIRAKTIGVQRMEPRIVSQQRSLLPRV